MNEVVQPEEGVLPENPAPEQPESPETPAAPETPETPEQPEPEDYRGKLNATNRFLQSEGYEWKDGKWQKRPANPQPESGQPPKKDGPDLSALEQRVVKAELRGAGHTHPDDQKFILDAARRLGVEPLEAAADEFVAQRLEKMREARKTKEATPQPGRGTGPTPRKVKDAWDMTDAEFEKERARIMQGK